MQKCPAAWQSIRFITAILPRLISTLDGVIHYNSIFRRGKQENEGFALLMQKKNTHCSRHVSTATREVAKARFAALKEGQNFHDLGSDLKTTYSNADRTQNTIYMRLKYDDPSGTVVNVRKSMWVHPELDRAISIREAARLQTFPDTFIFEGSKDSQYQQVGNAVPPFLSNAIARSLVKALDAEKK